MMRAPATATVLVLLALLTITCRRADAPEPEATPTGPPVVVPGTGSRPDTVAPIPDTAVLAALDSLRIDVRRLREAMGAMPPTAGRDTTTTFNPTEQAAETAEAMRHVGLRVVWGLMVLALAWAFLRLTGWLLDALAERSATRRLLFKRLVPVVRLLVWAVVTYHIVADVFQVDRASLLAAAAAIGVAVGFAAQDVLKNIFGGLIIILDQPFQVGDKVRIENTYGEVKSIGLRATRIVTPDDNLVSVPNAKVVEGQVANANAGALDCQVVVDLFVPGWVDVLEAKRLAYAAVANSKYVYLEKPIVVNVRDEFKETFLTRLVVKAYVIDTRYEFAFASDVTEAAKVEFQRHGLVPVGWPWTRPAASDAQASRPRAPE